MFDLSFITKMIPPKKGVEMLKAGLENILQEKIDHFEVTYSDTKEEIFFTVYSPTKGVIFQPYSGSNKEMIIFAVKNLAKMNLKEGESLDLVKCEYLPTGNINLDVFITKDEEKIKHQILNHTP